MSSNVNDNELRPQLERRRRYRRGHSAERIVAAVYMLLGHRILGRRFKTPVGEIDLIAIRGKRIAFVEVKRRPTQEDAEDAITLTMRRRVRRAADLWLAHNPKYQNCDVGFDLVFVVPWRFPIVMRDAL
ncbi:YraN family protein [Hyphomicrobium methylovorum]|uniref:YraN family protein n=1 Tax=Hyphomicrobium methylovorum TaxID=84 RepID=UPI0015E67CA6|nr:YraN family protein [Hyphomicrobium methylovorum]MBA2126254.1 YraN family protein [Hyphomicrobium methylovorum]